MLGVDVGDAIALPLLLSVVFPAAAATLTPVAVHLMCWWRPLPFCPAWSTLGPSLPPLHPDLTPPPSAPPAATKSAHTVELGDTFRSISQAYNTDVATIQNLNQGVNAAALGIGQVSRAVW